MPAAGVKKDIDNIYYLAENMLGRTFCPLGDAAAMPTMAFVKKFRKEFEDHLDGKPCPFEKPARDGVPGIAAIGGVAAGYSRSQTTAQVRHGGEDARRQADRRYENHG